MSIATIFYAILILAVSFVDARRRPLMSKEEFGSTFQNDTHSAGVVGYCAREDDYPCKYSTNEEDGIFVCRSWINKRGVELKKVCCFPSNRELLGTDECGCCGKECPKICNTCPCTTKQGRHVLEKHLRKYYSETMEQIVHGGRDEPVCRSMFMSQQDERRTS